MKNIIFDLDGTLLDSLKDLAISTNKALSECGYPTRTIEEIRLMVGNGVGKLVRRALPGDVTEEVYTQCLDIFKQHYTIHCQDNTSPYPGILQLLEELHDNGASVAVASNKLQPAVTKLCTHYFGPFLNYSLGESPELRRKPKPDMLLKAMELMKSTPSNTIYVGDSEVDIATAKAANVRCVSVLWGFRSKDFLVKNGAECFAEVVSDIKKFL